MNKRLITELCLLYKCEAKHKIPAAPIIRQLIADDERRLPDMLPPKPQWFTFHWPADTLDFTAEWQRIDRSIWRKEH